MARSLHNRWPARLQHPSTILTDMQTRTMQTKSGPEPRNEKNKAVRILAKSIYKDLTAQGYDERQIVNLASELIAEVTAQLAARSTDDPQ